jgi:ribosomal protein S27E
MSATDSDKLNGICCAICGRYFATDDAIKIIRKGRDNVYGKFHRHGYPVACNSCWHEDSIYQRAKVGTL